MGTRGFVGFVSDELETITYNHFDSYPSGLGQKVLSFVQEMNESEAREKAAHVRHVEDSIPPTREDVVALAKYADLGVSQRNLYVEWYGLLRETQGQPSLILDVGVAENAPDWPTDSLFCEYGYLVDFDARKLEVYKGFQTSPPVAGRWAGQRPAPRYEGDTNSYAAVELWKSYSFDELPTVEQFLEDLKEEDE